MFRHRLYQWLLVLLAVGLIAAGGTVQRSIDDLRREMDLERGEDVAEASVELRLLQAMPGFLKAVLLNYLWIHSETQKERGQFYDADYTSQRICKLMPRFPAVWTNRAWNLAYNISVKQHTDEQRWACVQNGIRLLRNEGLKHNPQSLPLYRELAYIYRHKLGQVMDDMHKSYKEYHAGEFHRILGAPPQAGAEDDMERYRRWFQPIVEAPDDEEALLANADVAAMVRQLKALDVKLGLPLLEAYNTWSVDPLVRLLGQPVLDPDTQRKVHLQRLMTDPALAAPREAIVAFSRRKVLREDYRMKPSWMLHLAESYGPIDWRVVWAHSLYWSTYGLNHIKGLDVTELDSINTGRHIIDSLSNLGAFGRLTLHYNPQEPKKPHCQSGTDWRFVEACHQAYLRTGEFFADGEAVEDDEAFGAYKTGHENFLRRAVQVLFFAGRIEQAERYLDYLRREYGRGFNPIYKLDLEDFVWYLLDEQGLRQVSTIKMLVNEMVDQAFLNLAAGNDEAYQFQLDRAHFFWRTWNTLVGHDTRKELEPFDTILSQGVLRAFQQTTDPEAAMAIWERMTDAGQRVLYDLLDAQFRDICERQGIDFDKAFPAPPGMAEFRAAREAWRQQRVTPGSETGVPWRAKTPDPYEEP